MSPLNRGPLMGPRLPPAGMRQLPPPRFVGIVGRLTPHDMPPRMLPPLNPMFGPRQRLPPRPLPPRPLPPRPTGGVSRPNGMLPRFPAGPRARGMAPIVPSMGPRGSGLPRGPPMRPWRMPMPSQMMPPVRLRYGAGNGTAKGKAMGGSKKVKIEELELKKPWMTDEIRNEIQRKNKLYVKAKKNKDAVEWEEFKDLRNKVTKMIRDAKNEYLAKHPEQAHLYPDEEPYDQRDENYVSSDDDNTTYYCEVCDRDFPSEDVFSEHKSTHMLCGIDGCTFSAHPLLVEKHISMQHRTGLYQRMKNLSTPEDIDKWIMERKKRYPTEENIKLRKAEELEKIQRGEVIKQTYNVRTKTRKKPANTREKKRKPRKRHARETNNSCIHMEGVYRGLSPFAGITTLQEEISEVYSDEHVEQTDFYGKVNDISDDEDDVLQSPAAAEDVPQAAESTNLSAISSPALFSLVADYESEDNDEGPEEVPVKKIKVENLQDKITENTIHEKNSTQVCVQKASDTRSFTNVNDKSNDFRNTVVKMQDKQYHKPNRMINNKNEEFRRRYHSTLLEKLLSRSIQHERNLICQCIKYIIENNFFDIN